MVHQQIAGDGCDPGHERSAFNVVRVEGAVHLDEALLGQILRIIARASKPVTDVVNAAIVPLDDFLPCGCVARNTATDQQSSHMGVFQQLHSPESLADRALAGSLRPTPTCFAQRYAQPALEVQTSENQKLYM